jgi:nuclear pore complex protein Nup107
VRASSTGNEDGMTEEEKEALLREHRTWQLLRAVYEYVEDLIIVENTAYNGCSNRIHRSDPEFQPINAKDQSAANPYIPPDDLTQIIVNEDDDLSLFAVRLK